MDPHQLAKDGLCQYTGDLHPLDHDGAWYDNNTWIADGYADCVRVTVMPEGPDGGRHVCVERLTILKKDPADLDKAVRSCGPDFAEYEKACLDDRIRIEIEACLGYGYYDPNQSDWREPSAYQFVVPDDDHDSAVLAKYCKIHGAKVATEKKVWERLKQLVGRDSCG